MRTAGIVVRGETGSLSAKVRSFFGTNVFRKSLTQTCLKLSHTRDRPNVQRTFIIKKCRSFLIRSKHCNYFHFFCCNKICKALARGRFEVNHGYLSATGQDWSLSNTQTFTFSQLIRLYGLYREPTLISFYLSLGQTFKAYQWKGFAE